MSSEGQWLRRIPGGRREGAERRIVLFPHAGSFWTTYIPLGQATTAAGIGTFILELPGRGMRWREVPVDNFESLAASAARALLDLPPVPTVFLGHSMGSIAAFETALTIGELSGTLVPSLLVSACPSPDDIEALASSRAACSDSDLLDNLRRIGAIPDEVWNHEEYLGLLLRAYRDDWRLLSTYRMRRDLFFRGKLMPILGTSDHVVKPDSLKGWLNCALDCLPAKHAPGGHFFVLDSAFWPELLETLELLFEP